jgi:hypothetical protein
MSTTNLLEGRVRPERKADSLTAICDPNVYKNVKTSTSHNLMGFHGLLQRQHFLTLEI